MENEFVEKFCKLKKLLCFDSEKDRQKAQRQALFDLHEKAFRNCSKTLAEILTDLHPLRLNFGDDGGYVFGSYRRTTLSDPKCIAITYWHIRNGLCPINDVFDIFKNSSKITKLDIEQIFDGLEGTDQFDALSVDRQAFPLPEEKDDGPTYENKHGKSVFPHIDEVSLSNQSDSKKI